MAKKAFTDEEIDAAAQAGYLAFGAAMGYKNLRGEDLPTWNSLAVVVQAALRNGAFAILTQQAPKP